MASREQKEKIRNLIKDNETAMNPEFSNNKGDKIKLVNPTTGKTRAEIKLHSKQQTEKLIEKTHEAFQSWRTTSLEDRAKVWSKTAEILSRDKNELAMMMSEQMGKPIEQGKDEIDLCIGICKYTAEHGPSDLADEKRTLDGDASALITYQPLGVILGIQPWNFPFYQCMRYSVAVMMAGNATVFRHAEICFETAARIEKIFLEAGLPDNVFTPLYLDSEAVDELISHDLIRGVTFTGSAKVGKKIGRLAGENLKKSVLELGGSDAYIVLKDSDIDKVVKTCTEGRIYNNGQTCVNAKRFIIEKDVYDAFKEKYVQSMKSIQYGDPKDSSNDMGPISKMKLRKKLHEQVSETINKGAKLLCGGEIPSGDGYFYPATVLEDIPKDTPAFEDELFGPVASLFKAEDEDDAVRIANDHRYGLGGGIFSADLNKATEIARNKIEAGIINVNTYGAARPNIPFGGVKESGYGREHGGFGMKEFVNAKSVVLGS